MAKKISRKQAKAAAVVVGTPKAEVIKPAPKGWLFAKDAVTGDWYAMKSTVKARFQVFEKQLTFAPDGKTVVGGHVRVRWYDPLGTMGWLMISLDPTTLLCNDPKVINALPEVPDSVKGDAAMAKGRGRQSSGIKRPRKERAVIAVEKHDGKRVFVGTLGGHKILMDAGDGVVVLELKDGQAPKDVAAKRKLTLVVRKEATVYASNVYQQAWEEQHSK